MRANEFLSELVSRADDLEHFKKRIKYAAKLCQGMGNHPLVFREFEASRGAETLLLKVQNQEGEKSRFHTKSGWGREGQDAILAALGIRNPTFTIMDKPYGPRGFHGYSHIFIPIGDHTPWWSTEIEDLGGQRLGSGDKEKKGDYSWMKAAAEKWAKTYQHAWPKEYTKHELIFDVEEYYLLNLEAFFNRFSGPEYKKYVKGYSHNSKKFYTADPSVKFDPKAFTELTSYPQIAEYLMKSLEPGGYLDWWENVRPKQQAEKNRKESLFLKIHNTWIQGGGFKNPKSTEEIAKELGIELDAKGMPV